MLLCRMTPSCYLSIIFLGTVTYDLCTCDLGDYKWIIHDTSSIEHFQPDNALLIISVWYAGKVYYEEICIPQIVDKDSGNLYPIYIKQNLWFSFWTFWREISGDRVALLYICLLCDEVLLPWNFRSPGFDIRAPQWYEISRLTTFTK